MVSGMPEPTSVRSESYGETAYRHSAERDRYANVSRRLSYARLVSFLAAAACLLSLVPGAVSYAGLRVALGGAGFTAFAVLVYVHARVEGRERWFAALARVNVEAHARVARNWNALPASDVNGPGPDHAFAGDLDLFGRASLFQLLGWVATEPGKATLARWLTEAAPAGTVRLRQAAVAELAAMPRAREEFAALGRLVEPEQQALDGLLDWAEQGPWFSRRRWVPWAVLALTILLVPALVGYFAGAVNHAYWVYLLGASVTLMIAFGKRVHSTFTRVFTRAGALQHHAALFARISGETFQSPLLVRLQEDLRSSGQTASREIGRLSLLGQFAELRSAALLHLIIAPTTLWDFHLLIALERWQQRAGANLRRWYAALGEFDALAALASLAHDNPSWAFPRLDDDAQALDARELGHPLLPEERRVANDVRVGPPGTFLMVTGSNMSGKSTLLRAVGINVVLAQAGGPVCAAAMTMPPLSLSTSMRVQDSLEEGVSYFMAAVRRLAVVVEAARKVGPREPMLLYLLDEVLQGTNTAERQVAVRRIVHHLMTLRAIGVVTTHDLELAACDELAGASQSVHFSEAVEHDDEGLRLTFDYLLKPGVATSRNALKLLKIVGLDVERG